MRKKKKEEDKKTIKKEGKMREEEGKKTLWRVGIQELMDMDEEMRTEMFTGTFNPNIRGFILMPQIPGVR